VPRRLHVALACGCAARLMTSTRPVPPVDSAGHLHSGSPDVKGFIEPKWIYAARPPLPHHEFRPRSTSACLGPEPLLGVAESLGFLLNLKHLV
jgi:hypothetical protein